LDVDMPDRALKRPWAVGRTRTRAGCVTVFWGGSRGQGNNKDQDRTVAEADMEIIRTMRALKARVEGRISIGSGA